MEPEFKSQKPIKNVLTYPPKTDPRDNLGQDKKEVGKISRKQFAPEQIIAKLLEARVFLKKFMTTVK